MASITLRPLCRHYPGEQDAKLFRRPFALARDHAHEEIFSRFSLCWFLFPKHILYEDQFARVRRGPLATFQDAYRLLIMVMKDQ